MKHLVRDSMCMQPYAKSPKELYRVVKSAPRVWVATTWCGLGLHGDGDFPHKTLRYRVDENEGWCDDCLADHAGTMAADEEFGRPNLRAAQDLENLR